MVKVAKIKNQSWLTKLVPLHKARSMMIQGLIEDFTTVEVSHIKNENAPVTQRQFEREIWVESTWVKPTVSQEDTSALITTNKMLSTKIKNSNTKVKELEEKIQELESKKTK